MDYIYSKDECNIYYPSFERITDSQNTYFKFQMHPMDYQDDYIRFGRLMQLQDITIGEMCPYYQNLPRNCGSIWIELDNEYSDPHKEYHSIRIHHAAKSEQSIEMAQTTHFSKRYLQISYQNYDALEYPIVENIEINKDLKSAVVFKERDFVVGMLNLEDGEIHRLKLSEQVQPVWLFFVKGFAHVMDKKMHKGDSYAIRAQNELIIQSIADDTKLFWIYSED